MNRRLVLAVLAAWGAGARGAGTQPMEQELAPWRLGATWAEGSGAGVQYHAGVLHWSEQEVAQAHSVRLPGRAHGLQALPDGGMVVAAVRPGNWLWRGDAQARTVVQWQAPQGARTLDGHVCLSADGQWLFTSETDAATSQGWVSVRDVRTLEPVAQFRSGGVEPHQLLVDEAGKLWVANGGLLRGAADRKRDIERMDSSLVCIDPAQGERLGQWRLKDARLGLRHMAWSRPQAGQGPLLGIALQNEHDDLDQRRTSTVLAVWDGRELRSVALQGLGGGYGSDIVAASGGGFVVSCQRSHLALWWDPVQAPQGQVVAQLQDLGALAAPMGPDGPQSLMAAARVAGRWHPRRTAAAVAWPRAIKLDNHWVALVG